VPGVRGKTLVGMPKDLLGSDQICARAGTDLDAESQFAMETAVQNALDDNGGPVGDAVLGANVVPSRADTANRMGHMWIFWTEDTGVPHRGYWPDFSQIPKDVRRSGDYREFFLQNRVPGRYVNESLNVLTKGMVEVAGDKIRTRSWPMSQQEGVRFGLRCVIAPDKDGTDEGFYSCDEGRADSENCCSWALKVMREAKRDAGFVPCDYPKRLSRVEIAIWGGGAPKT
jgi:hypothetical protein